MRGRTGSRLDRIRPEVPDGVASVTLTYRATRVTALVTSNYFAIAPPAAPQALTHAFTKLQEQIRASKPTAAQERRLAQLERDYSTYSVPAIVQWQNAAGAVFGRFRRPRTLPYDESGTATAGQTSFGPGLLAGAGVRRSADGLASRALRTCREPDRRQRRRDLDRTPPLSSDTGLPSQSARLGVR